MAARVLLGRAEAGPMLPAFERLAPPPPPDLVADRVETLTSPGEIVVDLAGRGGWIARAAVDRQRRAVSLEGSPLTRLLSEVVLRPPDLRHLDAAFQALAGSPKRETSLKVWIGDRFATRCATCGRGLVIDDLVWEPGEGDAPARPVSRHYRCTFCRDQRGGGEHRHGPPDAADLTRATDDGGDDLLVARERLRERFPVPDGLPNLPDDLLALHTPRQLTGLAAILERIESDLRAAPVEAALRLALLHSLLPASRLHAYPGRVAMLRVAGGRVKVSSGAWRERNPWLAFEDGFRVVRAFVARIDGGGPIEARLADDLRSLSEGSAMASLRVATASAYRALATEARDAGDTSGRGIVRLAIAQPPLRPSPERIAFAYLMTSWVLGREAASMLPLEALAGGLGRVPWGWQAAALGRILGAVEPAMARDGRVVLLCDAVGDEPLVAAVLGGVAAGYRVVTARLAEPGEEAALVELAPPGAVLPPGPRTRANVALPPVPGGAGDPDLVPARGLFAAPERYDARPFSAMEAALAVTETAVDVLKARGEPARTERLLGEILVGLDRAGHLRRLVAAGGPADAGGGATDGGEGPAAGATGAQGSGTAVTGPADGSTAEAKTGLRLGDGRSDRGPRAPALWERRPPREDEVATGQVERLLGIVHAELRRSDQRRLLEIEPGRWWLADRADQDAAALPLADRIEWAVFSLLSTAGPLTEAAFLERIATLFTGHDLPDELLVRTCLESYRSLASTRDQLVTGDDLLRRTLEHAETLALLAELGHAMGFAVWLSAREQERPVRGRRLEEWLRPRERTVHLPLITRAPAEALAEVDVIWYVRNRMTILFEVEWTAMLADPILRRHARIPGDGSTVRFLVVAPERTELIRHKLDRSPLLRAAISEGNWHILKTNHLRSFASLGSATLDALEPYLGLDPFVERTGEQLPLFEG
jgi:hypothetical protein